MTSLDQQSLRSDAAASPATHSLESLRALYASVETSIARGEEITGVELALLRAGVRAFVRWAKRRGEPPESVIASLKAATVGSAPYYRMTRPQRLLRDKLVGWYLDEYYGPSDIGGLP